MMHCPTVLALLSIIHYASARRGGWSPQVAFPDPEIDWATKHLESEHHLSNFDAGAFFTLHDLDNSGGWTPDEIRTMYGLESEESKHVTPADKEKVTREVFKLYDEDKNGIIEREEWLRKNNVEGIRLPDFGLGPGHHGDYEEEYEIHHFEKYHSGPDVKEEDLTHPEDIEHFARHEKEEEELEHWERVSRQAIIEENIPAIFRRN